MSRYLLQTSRKSDAVIGSCFGNFDGSDNFFHLIIGSVNRVDVWECTAAEALSRSRDGMDALLGGSIAPISVARDEAHEAGSNTSPSRGSMQLPFGPALRQKASFPVNGTIKHLLPVPVPCAKASRHPRLLLFMVTEKQDVSIVALRRVRGSDSPHLASASEKSRCESEDTIEFDNLFTTNLCSSLFQRNFGQRSLCTSTFSATIFHGDDISISVVDEDYSAPIVALSNLRHFVVLFDIAACIVEGAVSSSSTASTATGDQVRHRGVTVAATAGRGGATAATVKRSRDGLPMTNAGGSGNDDNLQEMIVPPLPASNDGGQDEDEAQGDDNDDDDGRRASGGSDDQTGHVLNHLLQRTRLFSIAFISNHLLAKSHSRAVCFCPIVEAEPRSICLQRSPNSPLALIVLSQDIRGRSHVTKYSVLRDVPQRPPANPSDAALARGPPPPGSRTPLGAILDRSDLMAPAAHEVRLSAVSMLQSDVEADACLLHAVSKGVVVVGGALATFISTDSRGFSTTTVTPHPEARCEPIAAVTISPITTVVGYQNGAIMVVSMMDTERGELTCHLLAPSSTPLSCLCPVGSRFFFAGSLYHHSAFISRDTGAAEVAFPNTGPILEMIRFPTAAAKYATGGGTIVAATGVEAVGALQCIRSAVPFRVDASMKMPGLLSIFSIGSPRGGAASRPLPGGYLSILCLAFETESRFLLLTASSTASNSDAMGGLVFDECDYVHAECVLSLIRAGESAAVIAASASSAVLLEVSPAAGLVPSKRVDFERPANLTASDPRGETLAVASGRQISLYELPSLEFLTTVHFEQQISALDMTEKSEVIVGLWDTRDVFIFSPLAMEPKHLITLRTVPRSLVLVALPKEATKNIIPVEESATPPAFGEPAFATGAPRHLLASFSDGSVEVVPIEGDAMEHTTRTTRQGEAAVGQRHALGSLPPYLHRVSDQDGCVCGVLAVCDAPGYFFNTPLGIAATGYGGVSMDAWTSLTGNMVACYQRNTETLLIGRAESGTRERINAVATPVEQTVLRVRYVDAWQTVIIATRDRCQDKISAYTMKNGVLTKNDKFAGDFSLLESERCECLEAVAFNGDPFVPSRTCTGVMDPSSANTSMQVVPKKQGRWDPTASFHGVIAGSNFVYPNDDTPRNGRIVLLGLEHSAETGRFGMVQLAERDIRGMVLSVCQVPNTNNRLLVGIGGTVQMLRWSPADETFVYEIAASIGAGVIKFVPLLGSSLGTRLTHPPSLNVSVPPMTPGPRPQHPMETSNNLPGTSSNDDTGVQDDDEPLATEPQSSLILCVDIRNSAFVLALDPVELIRTEAADRTQREMMDVIDSGAEPVVLPDGTTEYHPHFLSSDTDLNFIVLAEQSTLGVQRRAVVPRLSRRGQAVEVGITADNERAASAPGPSGAAPAPAPGPLAGVNTVNNKLKSRLLPSAQFHVGDRITTFQRGTFRTVQSRSQINTCSDADLHQTLRGAAGRLHEDGLSCFVFGTVHGVLGSVTPIRTLAFNLLELLQGILGQQLPSFGNISYDAFRRVFDRDVSPYVATQPRFAESPTFTDYDAKRALRKYRHYGVIDGDLLARWFLLPRDSSEVLRRLERSSYGPVPAGATLRIDQQGIVVALNEAICRAALSGKLFTGAVDLELEHFKVPVATELNGNLSSDAASSSSRATAAGDANREGSTSQPATPVVQHVDPNTLVDMRTGKILSKEERTVGKAPLRSVLTDAETEELNAVFAAEGLPLFPINRAALFALLEDVKRYA